MEHPARYWIRFLLSRREHSFEEIQGMCEMMDIGGVSIDYLSVQLEDISHAMPTPFRGGQTNHRPSIFFIRREQIYDAWMRTPSMREALEILGNKNVRPLVETFILSPLKPEQAVSRINATRNSLLTAEGYQLFRHYFWNTSLLTGEQLGAYIEARRESQREWLRLAMNAHGPSGVQLLLWKTGTGAVRHLDASKIFTHLRNIAYFKALELEQAPAGRDHSTAFRNYVHSAKMAQEEATNSTTAMTDVLDSFRAFRMRTEDHEVASFDELTGGQVSPALPSAGEDVGEITYDAADSKVTE